MCNLIVRQDGGFAHTQLISRTYSEMQEGECVDRGKI